MKDWDWNALGRWPLLLASVLAFVGSVYIFSNTGVAGDDQVGGYVLVILGAALLGGFLVVEGHNMHQKDIKEPPTETDNEKDQPLP